MKIPLLFAISLGAFGAELAWDYLPLPEKAKNSEPFDDQIVEINFSDNNSALNSWAFADDFWNNPRKPYRGVHRAGLYEWTAVDAKQPEIIQFLATDREMFKRLCEQNRYVIRRQFVYVSPKFDQVTEEINAGTRSELKLPGFDGEQLSVIVDNVDIGLAGGIAAWDGHLLSEPESIVQASAGSAELPYIEIHREGRQLRYEMREANQWIIQEFDLKALAESNSDHMASKKKKSSVKIFASQQ